MELMQNEGMIWQGRPSWRAMMSFYTRWILIGLLPFVAGILLDRVVDNGSWAAKGALVSAVIIAGVLLIGWLRRISTVYTVTDRRIIIRRGILSRREQEAHIDRVQNVNMVQTPLDRLFHVGTLDFDTAGSDDSDFKFRGVAEPEKLRARINEEYVLRSREMGTTNR
jgi:uncharacterized membrane protein YdbT with pleckstrin-like domain